MGEHEGPTAEAPHPARPVAVITPAIAAVPEPVPAAGLVRAVAGGRLAGGTGDDDPARALRRFATPHRYQMIRDLQRTHGNRAVALLLAGGHAREPGSRTHPAASVQRQRHPSHRSGPPAPAAEGAPPRWRRPIRDNGATPLGGAANLFPPPPGRAGGVVNVGLPATVAVRYAPSIRGEEGIRQGLRNVAAELIADQRLPPDTSVTVPLAVAAWNLTETVRLTRGAVRGGEAGAEIVWIEAAAGVPAATATLAVFTEAERRELRVAEPPSGGNFAAELRAPEQVPPGVEILYGGGLPEDDALRRGLRNHAAGVFALNGPAPQANTVVTEALDLGIVAGSTLGARAIRFTFVDQGRGTGRRRRLLIEDLGPRAQDSPLSPQARAGLLARFAPFGLAIDPFLQTHDAFLRALDAIPDGVLARVRDVPFRRTFAQRGPDQEVGQYHWEYGAGGAYRPGTREVRIFDEVLRPGQERELAETVAHEVGHALTHRPGEQGQAPSEPAYAHNRSAFAAAVVADGGWSRRLTPYPATIAPDSERGHDEYFADAYARFVTAPDLLRQLRPHVFAWFAREYAAPSTQPTAASQGAGAAVPPTPAARRVIQRDPPGPPDHPHPHGPAIPSSRRCRRRRTTRPRSPRP